MLGAFIKSRRKELGMTQEELGDRVGRHFNTISAWERTGNVPTSMYLTLAKELGVTVSALKKMEPDREFTEPDQTETPRLVESQASFTRWFNELSQSGIDTELFIVMAAIGREASTPPWVASVSIDYLLERTPLTRELLERMWPQVLKSEWLERRGSGEWTFILKFPE